MARPARTRHSRGVLRGLVVALAVLLAAGATAAVVLTEDPQWLRLAVVGAVWAFILLALAVPRRRPDEAVADPATAPGAEVELRRTYEIELEREVAARREYELQLEVYLRRELERGLAEDVQTLRDEIQAMRGEMFERLDGELRMERIETTRLIGGSLRALQDEARRLGMRVPVAEPSFSVRDPAAPPVPSLPSAPPAQTAPAASSAPAAPSSPAYASVPAPRSELSAGEPAGRAGDLTGYPTDAVPSAPAASPYSPFPSYAGRAEPAPYEVAYPTAPPPAPAPPGPLDAYLATRSDPPPSRVDELGPILGGPLGDLPPARPDPAPARLDPAPVPRSPYEGEAVPRRRRARSDGEDNEVMSRLLGR